MSEDRFQACLSHTLKWEGGWSNHPKDRGGATMRGVIQRVYDGWRDRQGLPRRSVRSIEETELQAIYRRDYWDAVRGDDLPPGVDLAVFDFGVNSGPTRSIRYLQTVLGVTVDGHIGPATLGAIRSRNHMAGVVEKIMVQRRGFLRGLRDYPTFGKGWENRCNGIEPAALAMAGDNIGEIPVCTAEPLADADAQACTQGRATAEREPISPKVLGPAVAVGGGAAVKVTETIVAAPPAEITQTVTNLTAWQMIGKAIVSFGNFLVTDPVAVAIVAVIVFVFVGPRYLLPMIWSRQ